MSVAMQLLEGFHNIDRMRREVHEVVSAILGLVKDGWEERSSEWVRVVQSFGDDGCAWHFYGYIFKRDRKILVSKVQVTCAGNFVPDYSHVYYDTENPTQFRAEKVAMVHGGLDVFVEMMFKKFPGLQKKCEPFLKAGSKS